MLTIYEKKKNIYMLLNLKSSYLFIFIYLDNNGRKHM